MLEITAAHPRSVLSHTMGKHTRGVVCFMAHQWRDKPSLCFNGFSWAVLCQNNIFQRAVICNDAFISGTLSHSFVYCCIFFFCYWWIDCQQGITACTQTRCDINRDNIIKLYWQRYLVLFKCHVLCVSGLLGLIDLDPYMNVLTSNVFMIKLRLYIPKCPGFLPAQYNIFHVLIACHKLILYLILYIEHSMN